MNRLAIKARSGLILVLVIALGLLFAACGGGSDTAEVPADTSSTEAQDTTAQTTETEQVAETEQTSETEQVAETEQTSETEQITETEGHKLFVARCAKCHGLEGLGNGPSVGSLSTQAGLNLTILNDKSDEELLTTISQGKGSEMPPWGLILPLEEREELVKHIRALSSQ